MDDSLQRYGTKKDASEIKKPPHKTGWRPSKKFETSEESSIFSLKIYICNLKIYICNLKIRICNLQICIFNLKIELSSEVSNFLPSSTNFSWGLNKKSQTKIPTRRK